MKAEVCVCDEGMFNRGRKRGRDYRGVLIKTFLIAPRACLNYVTPLRGTTVASATSRNVYHSLGCATVFEY